jgi:two-component system, NarL family, nitrate/nitrite response regulator NarL
LAKSITKRVFLVDDNRTIRSLLRSLIEIGGFTICAEAENGFEAIEKASQCGCDLILLDLDMPVINGLEAAAILKKQLPYCKIILFTLHSDSVNSILAEEMGVDRVIAKPDGMTKLLDAMRDVLGLAPPSLIGPLQISSDLPVTEIQSPQLTADSDGKPPE